MNNIIEVSEIREGIFTITMNKLKERNSIDSLFIKKFNESVTYLENLDECKVIVIEGQKGFFCIGMDLNAFTQSQDTDEEIIPLPEEYMMLMKRISRLSKVVIGKIDGQVIGGGVGIAMVCDYIVASPQTVFSLPEAIWGLLPAMVAPYLIRRVGYWQAYKMAITTVPVGADEALKCRMIDEISLDLNKSIIKISKRLCRISPDTVEEIKSFFSEMWIIDKQMELKAVDEITKLAGKKHVIENIENYAKNKTFPWEN